MKVPHLLFGEVEKSKQKQSESEAKAKRETEFTSKGLRGPVAQLVRAHA
jgi:hypothetical protein